jgi:SAM-dependent methyltransferase
LAVSDRLLRRLYAAPCYDGTAAFYSSVRARLTPQSRVLNLGAGPPTGDPVRILKGEVAELVGADVDRCVLSNPELDRAVLIEDGRLPLDSAAFDLILSDYVFEHVRDPARFLAEAFRVLKPGGSLMFRTPNRFHYVAIISALTPHRVHTLLANAARAKPRGSQAPWRTCYNLNDVQTLRRRGRDAGFARLAVTFVETEPAYLRFNTLAFLAGVAYERAVNSTDRLAPLRANIFGRFMKAA